MNCGRIPLFPPGCMPQSNLQLPLFDCCDRGRRRGECQCVRMENPACPGEFADVELCVDMDGNLSICVRRPPRPCAPRRRPGGRCDCIPWR